MTSNKDQRIKVACYFRKPYPDSYSIEGIFNTILNFLPENIKTFKTTMPFYSKGILKRVYNIIWSIFQQQQINHITGDTHYVSLLLVKRKTIVTIHDLEMLFRYKGLTRWLIWLLWFYLPSKRIRYFTVISEFTKEELLRLVPSISPSKVKVIHDCYVSELKYDPVPFHTECPVILQIGTKHNKNVPNLIKALHGIHCKLVILGTLDDSLNHILQASGINYENYHNLSYPDVENLYRSCDFLVFVSTYEGFGLPILEAQSVGRPVVTSNAASMPEVAGEAAVLVDPHDIQSIRNGIQKVIKDENLRKDLIQKGLKNVKRFTPERIASEYAKLYLEIIPEEEYNAE